MLCTQFSKAHNLFTLKLVFYATGKSHTSVAAISIDYFNFQPPVTSAIELFKTVYTISLYSDFHKTENNKNKNSPPQTFLGKDQVQTFSA